MDRADTINKTFKAMADMDLYPTTHKLSQTTAPKRRPHKVTTIIVTLIRNRPRKYLRLSLLWNELTQTCSPGDQYGPTYPPAKRPRGSGRGGAYHSMKNHTSQQYQHDYYSQSPQSYPGSAYFQTPQNQHEYQYPTVAPQALPTQPTPPTWSTPNVNWQTPPQGYNPQYPTPTPYDPRQPQPYPQSTPPANHWYAGKSWSYNRGQGSHRSQRGTPYLPSSVQWRRPKTPPEKKDSVISTQAESEAEGQTASVDSKEGGPMRNGQMQTTKPDRVGPQDPYPGLDYYGGDIEGWYFPYEHQGKGTTLGSILWRAPLYVSHALPASYSEADEILKMHPPSSKPQASVSVYCDPAREKEQIAPVRQSSIWPEVQNDPVFQDLMNLLDRIPISQAKENRNREDLTSEDHKRLQRRQEGMDIDNSGTFADHVFDQAQEVTAYDGKSNQLLLNVSFYTDLRYRKGNPGHPDEEEAYSPPPAATSRGSSPSQKTTRHKRKFSQLDPIEEEYDPSVPGGLEPRLPTTNDSIDDIQTKIVEIEKKSTSDPDFIQARIEAITNARQIQAKTEEFRQAEIQARIDLLTSAPGTARTDDDPNQTSNSQSRKQSTNSEVHEPRQRGESFTKKPTDFPKNDAQEDILAKLGVTGMAKPVYTMPPPARTDPPPGYDRQSRSRSRSQSPVKGMSATQSVRKIAGSSLHEPPPLPPPPPPPVMTAEEEPSFSLFGRTSSSNSQRTAAWSDIQDDTNKEAREQRPPLGTIHEENGAEPADSAMSNSAEIDRATAERLQKRPPKIPSAYQ